MSAGKLFAIIFFSALMGGLVAVGGYVGFMQTQPAPTPLPNHLASTDPLTAKAREANLPGLTTPGQTLLQSAVTPIQLPPGGDAEEQIVTAVYSRVAPSVVNIHTTTVIPTFFGNQTNKGSGSGVIVSKDGYILTNTHVVAGSQGRTELNVTFQDGTSLAAKWKGIDGETDLAVIQLIDPPADLPVAEIGKSDTLEVGQRAIVIGNPYGLDSSISVGVVSALNRSIDTEGRRYEGMIQTDAAVNPGNSGGPLLNSLGQVVGINTVIFTQSGGSQGIGFAIPIDFAMKTVEDLITFGKVRRPYLGVKGLVPLGPALADFLGLNVRSGVLVQQLLQGGPAQKAGLRPGTEPIALARGQYILKGGDIIMAINGQEMHTGDQVVSYVRNREVGEVITVEVWRDNGLKQIQVHLEASP